MIGRPKGLVWRFLCDLDSERHVAGGDGWMKGTPPGIGDPTAKAVIEAGWAESKPDGYRKLYRITPLGEAVVKAEIAGGHTLRLTAHLY